MYITQNIKYRSMDVISGKQARERTLVGTRQGLLVMGDHNALIPPPPDGEGVAGVGPYFGV